MLHKWHGTIALINQALAEDEVANDTTTRILDPNLICSAEVISKEKGVVSGIDVCIEVFLQVDSQIIISSKIEEGSPVEKGQVVISLAGSITSILRAERTALNFIQRMSGIATLTRKYVDAISDTNAALIDTRKTVPGWRLLDKAAVRAGGGKNHRMNLADGVLIKDNHIAAAAAKNQTLPELIKRAKLLAPHTVKIEVECETIEEVALSLESGADIIMLDNMETELMREAVEKCKGIALTEASGGITIDSIREIALTGVDFISTGAITHSVKALDLSLDINLEVG